MGNASLTQWARPSTVLIRTLSLAGKRWRSDVMLRKLLSHMLQGLESRAVYQFVHEHQGLVCALEHDGFISYEKIDDSD